MRDEVAAAVSATPRIMLETQHDAAAAHSIANPVGLSPPDIEIPLRMVVTPARGKPRPPD
ncbi:hypothetical protein BJA01nite_13000 [Bradyrhizobium japonicum]|nr:hypothetical protein BJ6T_36880 [Bradyrhizobium japonicum USDA 6]GEC43658.1 hypothetical protein BJA01nite_13000 [Bradyrhizobium japonicum]